MDGSRHNLLFLSRISGWGGAEKSLLDLLKNLDKKKFRPFLALPDKEGQLYLEAEKSGIGVTIIRMPFLHITYNPLKWLFFIIKIIHINMVFLHFLKKANISMAVCNTIQDSIYIALPSKLLKRKLVIYIKGILDKKWKKAFRSRVCDIFADKVITISGKVQQDVTQYMREPKKAELIYEGIDAGRFRFFSTGKDVYNDFLGNDGESFRILNIGNIAHLKGQRLLVESLSLPEFKNIDFKVFFLGKANFKKDLAYKKSIEEIIIKKGLGQKIFFLGFKKNVSDYIRYSDLLVHCPVLDEGLGLVILEAFCFNKIVVATRVGGIPEIIEDGKNGFMCRVDKDDLADKILYVYQNKDKMRQIGDKAAKTVKEKFSFQRQIKKTQEVYCKLLKV